MQAMLRLDLIRNLRSLLIFFYKEIFFSMIKGEQLQNNKYLGMYVVDYNE